MADEKFSLAKLFDFSPVGFYKVIGLSIKAGIIVLIIFGLLWVKNLLLPNPEIHKPEIHGETVNYYEGSKRRLEYFIGPTFSTDKDGEWRAGAFGGVKW